MKRVIVGTEILSWMGLVSAVLVSIIVCIWGYNIFGIRPFWKKGDVHRMQCVADVSIEGEWSTDSLGDLWFGDVFDATIRTRSGWPVDFIVLTTTSPWMHLMEDRTFSSVDLVSKQTVSSLQPTAAGWCLVGGIVLGYARRRVVVMARRNERLCDRCAYPRVGLTCDRCPECGTLYVVGR